jgi:hypothetical protein
VKKIAFAFLLLAGCGQAHIETRIQRVYCVTPEQYRKLVNAEPEKIGNKLTGQAQDDFKLSASQNVALRSYADGLLEVIGNCMSPAS